MKLILDLFAEEETGHSVTLYADAGVSAFEADETTDVAKDTEVTLTVTLNSGYEVDRFEVLAGGVEVDPEELTFTMGENDVAIYLRTKANNRYIVTEEAMASVNDAKVILHANTIVELTKNGAVKGVTVANGGTAITDSEAIQQLIKEGVLVKL